MPRRIPEEVDQRILHLYFQERLTMDGVVAQLAEEGTPCSRTSVARRLAEERVRRRERQRIEDRSLNQSLPPAQQVDTAPVPAQTGITDQSLRRRLQSAEQRIALIEDRLAQLEDRS